MEEQKAHDLYQQFSDVHAAAKSGRGLGFNTGGDIPASWKADESFERWQPSTKPDDFDSVSSRPVTHKKEEGRHRSHDGYTTSSRGDKHARQDDESRSDKGIDRHRIDRDSHWKHADRDDTRSHSKRVQDDRKCRSDRPNQRDCNRQSQDYEHWDRRDREDARDRSRHHDSRSRDEKGREQWHRATGTSRSRSEHNEHRGERDRDDPRDRSSHRERKTQDGIRIRTQRHRVTENSHSRPDASERSKEAKVDFERAIPGYAQMRAAERMKARTKLLLDKSSKQGLQHAKEGQWTRYVFNRDALLDEEGATPADGFSGDANAVSLRLPQAKAETQQRMMTAEEAHEAAIFGKSSTSALPQSQPQREEPPSVLGGGGLGLGAQPSWTNAATEVMETEPASRDANSPETIVAASVLHAQPGLSWRERAALKRKQLAEES